MAVESNRQPHHTGQSLDADLGLPSGHRITPRVVAAESDHAGDQAPVARKCAPRVDARAPLHHYAAGLRVLGLALHRRGEAATLDVRNAPVETRVDLAESAGSAAASACKVQLVHGCHQSKLGPRLDTANGAEYWQPPGGKRGSARAKSGNTGSGVTV